MKNIRFAIITAIILVILVFVGSAVRSWYLFLKEPVAPVVNAIPANSAVIVKTGSVFSLFDAIGQSSALELFSDNTEYRIIEMVLDSIERNSTKIYNILKSNDVYFAWSGTDNSSSGWLISTSVGKTSQKKITSYISEFIGSNYQVAKSGSSLYKISGNESKIWYYVKQGTFTLSNDSITLLRSFNNITGGTKLSDDPDFMRLLETGGKRVEANIIINNPAFADILMKDKSESLKNTPFDKWTSFDLNVRKGELMLDGFTLSGTSTLFEGQQPVEYSPGNGYPQNTALGFSILLSDQDNYINKIATTDTLHVEGYDAATGQTVTQLFNLNDHLYPWLGNSVNYILTDNYFKGDKSQILILLESRNSGVAASCLQSFIQPTTDSTGIMRFGTFAERMFGKAFKLPQPVYYSIINGYVALSSNQQLLTEYSSDETRQDSQLAGADEFAGKNSNLFIYLKPDAIKSWFIRQNKNTAAAWVSFFSKNKAIGIQYSAGAELQYTHAWMLPESGNSYTRLADALPANAVSDSNEKTIADSVKAAIKNEPEKSPLILEKETSEITLSGDHYKPVIVSDETGKNKRIAVISRNNTLTMYDHSGKVLWSFKASGKVRSQILEADYNKNGRTCYLLPTTDKLHIINSQGKEIKGSPVKLPGGIAGDIAIFDYDRRKDYRLLYVGNDSRIYNITLQGTELPDWQKPKVAGKGTVQFFRTSGRDYLIYKDKKDLHVFDRRGRERIKIGDNLNLSSLAQVFENKTNSKGIFISSSKNGELVYINEKGSISKSAFHSFKEEPWFQYVDFNNDGSLDFIFADSEEIIVFDRMKKVIKQQSFKNKSLSTPVIYTSSPRNYWIFSRNTKNNQIVGFSNSGKTFSKGIQSDTDPVVFNPGGSLKELLVTTRKGKLILTPLENM